MAVTGPVHGDDQLEPRPGEKEQRLAGPAHPVTIAIEDEIAPRMIERNAAREAAATKGHQW